MLTIRIQIKSISSNLCAVNLLEGEVRPVVHSFNLSTLIDPNLRLVSLLILM